MPNQHRHPPIPFRPPEGDRAWLLAHAAATGRPVNAMLADALRAYRASLDPEHAGAPGIGGDDSPGHTGF